MSSKNRTGAFGYRNVLLALRRIGVDGEARVLAIGPAAEPEILRGGVSALTAALTDSCRTVITPAFTYQTMVYPSEGPADNAVDYPAASAASVEADFFRASLPASPLMGPLSEAIRRSGRAARSSHPILSFAGWNAKDILETQTLAEPFAPIDELARAGGDVLLLGAEPSANVALHLAEQRAGRKQFVRWALTPKGVVECPVFPGMFAGVRGDRLHADRRGALGGNRSVGHPANSAAGSAPHCRLAGSARIRRRCCATIPNVLFAARCAKTLRKINFPDALTGC